MVSEKEKKKKEKEIGVTMFMSENMMLFLRNVYIRNST